MKYQAQWKSPIGTLTIASDGNHITGLWMERQKYFCAGLWKNALDGSDLPIIQKAIVLLDQYFRKESRACFSLPLSPEGTVFQKAVWAILQDIPQGETRTYGQIAQALEATTGRKTSPRAVGTAVGKNPISILIPCHRVVGARGSLTGYAGGIVRKEFLLNLEKEIGTA